MGVGWGAVSGLSCWFLEGVAWGQSGYEAVLAVTLKHCASVCEQWIEALNYIENMLRKQLIAAIGKEVSLMPGAGLGIFWRAISTR